MLSWDPSLRCLALAYPRQVQLFRAGRRLEPLGTLPVAGVASAAWGLNQLFLATPTSVLLAFVAAAEEAPIPGEDLLDMGPEPGERSAAETTLQVRCRRWCATRCSALMI